MPQSVEKGYKFFEIILLMMTFGLRKDVRNPLISKEVMDIMYHVRLHVIALYNSTDTNELNFFHYMGGQRKMT